MKKKTKKNRSRKLSKSQKQFGKEFMRNFEAEVFKEHIAHARSLVHRV